MTIGELIKTGLYDENEQVVVLEGESEPPRRLYEGYLWMVPEDFRGLEIRELSSLGEYRRKQWRLNHYGWTEIWVEEFKEEVHNVEADANSVALTEEEIDCFNAYIEDAKMDIAFGNTDWCHVYHKIVGDKVSEYAKEKMEKYNIYWIRE